MKGLGGGQRLQVALAKADDAAQYLMQPERDQQPVEGAVAEGAKRRGEQLGGEQGQPALQWRPQQREGDGDQQAGQGRHQQAGKLPPGDLQPAGQGLLVNPGIDNGGGESRQQAADHVGVQVGG